MGVVVGDVATATRTMYRMIGGDVAGPIAAPVV